jgi:hypothetical protein
MLTIFAVGERVSIGFHFRATTLIIPLDATARH